MNKTIKTYQVDAFTDKVFAGNPAAVCLLDDWLDEKTMQSIGAENNLAETAFLVKKDGVFEIRWFTPQIEVDLCGHATLASAHVLFNYYNVDSDTIEFQSMKRGKLFVSRHGDALSLDFPTDDIQAVVSPDILKEAIGQKPVETYKGKTDYALVLKDQEAVEKCKPAFHLLRKSLVRGIMITAPGKEVDFVSRFFAPQSGIDEDPVTGSAHTTLTPIWAKKLGKNKMTAKQLSARGGDLLCELKGERTVITGKAVTYLIGEIRI
jgi:PhzF family phenazine biosynthesis protein